MKPEERVQRVWVYLRPDALRWVDRALVGVQTRSAFLSDLVGELVDAAPHGRAALQTAEVRGALSAMRKIQLAEKSLRAGERRKRAARSKLALKHWPAKEDP